MLRAKRSSLKADNGRWIKELSLPRRISGEEEEDGTEEEVIVDNENGGSADKCPSAIVGVSDNNKENFDREGCSRTLVVQHRPPRGVTKGISDLNRPPLATGNSVQHSEERPSPDSLTGAGGVNRSDYKIYGRPTRPSAPVSTHLSGHTIPKSSSSEVQVVGQPVAVSKPLSKSSVTGDVSALNAKHQNQENAQESPELASGMRALHSQQPPSRMGHTVATPSKPPIRMSHTVATSSEPPIIVSHTSATPSQEQLSMKGIANNEVGRASHATSSRRVAHSQRHTDVTKPSFHHHHHHHLHPHKDGEQHIVPHSTSGHFTADSDSAHVRRLNEATEGGGVAVASHSTNRQIYPLTHTSTDYRHASERQQQLQHQHQSSSALTNDYTPSSYSISNTTTTPSAPLLQQDPSAGSGPVAPRHHQHSNHHHNRLQQHHHYHHPHHERFPHPKPHHSVTGDGKEIVSVANTPEDSQNYTTRTLDNVDLIGGTSAHGRYHMDRQRLDDSSTLSHTGSHICKKRSSTVHASCNADRQKLDVSSSSMHSGSHTYTPSNTRHVQQPSSRVTLDPPSHQYAKSSAVTHDGGGPIRSKTEGQDVCDGGVGEELKADGLHVLAEHVADEAVIMRTSRGQRKLKKLKAIGGGGSSKIFQVLSDNNEVLALKEVYMRHLDPVVQQSFLKEVQLLRQLQGKQEIIRLHDYSWDKEAHILYILLECADSDLNSLMKAGYLQHAVNPPLAIWQLWNEMLRIVKVIHDQGIIHNDLKPENFVCKGCNLRLIDFGISARIEAEHTSIERDVRCGTLNYMAPETIEATGDNDLYKVGKPSDIWSLGCILYQMVYRKTPFDHIKNKMKKWQAIINCSTSVAYPKKSSSYSKLVEVIKTCLIKEPKKRPTIDDLLVFSSPENFTLP